MKVQRGNEGQALILVLLGLAVVLTVVLFILSRSITDVAVSSSQSQSVSAFSAAEAGVEQALVIGTGGNSSVGSASYTSQVTNVGQNNTSFIYPVELNSGDAMTLFLKSQDSSPDFTGSGVKICWGKLGSYSDQNLEPAVEAVVFYETTASDPSTVKIFRKAYDPYSNRATVGVGGASNNGFSAPDNSNGTCSVSGQAFQFQASLSLSGLPNPQFAYVRMYYNSDTSHPIAFADSLGSHNFPTQGILVDSSGTAGGTASEPQSVRKVEVFQSWPEVPSVFQSSVYSSTGLTK